MNRLLLVLVLGLVLVLPAAAADLPADILLAKYLQGATTAAAEKNDAKTLEYLNLIMDLESNYPGKVKMPNELYFTRGQILFNQGKFLDAKESIDTYLLSRDTKFFSQAIDLSNQIDDKLKEPAKGKS